MERSNFMKDNHDSYIEEINHIKIRIHQSLYNGGPFLDNLLESVHRHLPSMNNISYDDNRDCLILTTDRVVSSISLSLLFMGIMLEYLDYLRNNNVITSDEYTIGAKRVNMLYDITLNTDTTIEIKL